MIFFILANLVVVDKFDCFGFANTITNEKGVISSDTTWTKENSPYVLTGPIFIDNGVTLTIEPGVVVDLNNFTIKVNGTLVAKGSTTDSIKFNNGQLTFFHCAPWSEQTNSGTIIEKALLINVYIKSYSSSIKINNNTISGGLIQSQVQASDADMNLYLMHKKFETTIISNNYITGGTASLVIEALNDDIVLNNTIVCTQQQLYGINAQYYSLVISNTITGSRGYGVLGGKYIAGNTISGFEVGIGAGDSTITNNLIFNNKRGISIEGAGCVIQNNTIVNNAIGVYSAKGYINYNNFEDSSEYNIDLEFSESNVNATSNWWGTTDLPVIDQKIRDYNDDFSLGKVDYVPILNEPNTQAKTEMPSQAISEILKNSLYPNLLATTSQSGNNSIIQSNFSFIDIAILTLLTIAILLVAVILYAYRNTKTSKNTSSSSFKN